MTEWKDKPVFSGAGVFERYSSRAGDSAFVVSIALQELPPEALAVLLGMKDKHIYLFVSEAKLTNASIIENMPAPIDIPVKTKGKSKSRLLRETLWVLFKAQDGDEKDFESYYEKMMDKYINHVKAQAEEAKNAN